MALMTTHEFVKWNQNVSDLPRPVQTLQGFRAVGAGYASGPSPKDGCCSRIDGDSDGGGERQKVCGDACCPLHNVLEAQRVVQPDG